MADKIKLPPQDLEAEASVLGALLLDKDAIVKVADFLESSDFYHPVHQKIYEAILNLWNAGKPIDFLTVSKEFDLPAPGNAGGQAGDVDYLTDLVSGVPTSAHVVHYANLVKEKRTRRDLIRASSEINESALAEGDFEGLLDKVEQRIFNISQRSRPQKFIHIKEELPQAYERLEMLHRGDKKSLRGIATGFTKLDNLLSGLQKSDLIIVGARPSVGKTSFVLDIARQAGLAGKSVGIFSIEMSKDQVIDRLLAAQAQIPLWRLRTGRIADDMEFSLVQQALDELSETRLFIDDTPSPTVLQMRSMARRLQLERKLDLLIVDYLQLVQPRIDSLSMVHQVTDISRGLKSLSRELGIPVVAVSQLSREVEKREVKIPRLSDLRESGSLEQDSDVVLFLYRRDRSGADAESEEQNIIEIIVAKHRNGPLGTVKLKFDPEVVSFRNIDTRYEED